MVQERLALNVEDQASLRKSAHDKLAVICRDYVCDRFPGISFRIVEVPIIKTCFDIVPTGTSLGSKPGDSKPEGPKVPTVFLIVPAYGIYITDLFIFREESLDFPICQDIDSYTFVPYEHIIADCPLENIDFLVA